MFFLLLVILLSRPEPVTDVPNTISGIMDTEPYCLRVQDFNIIYFPGFGKGFKSPQTYES
jgi:hypothetical protein